MIIWFWQKAERFWSWVQEYAASKEYGCAERVFRPRDIENINVSMPTLTPSVRPFTELTREGLKTCRHCGEILATHGFGCRTPGNADGLTLYKAG